MGKRGSRGSKRVRVSQNRTINSSSVVSVKIRSSSEFGDHRPRVELLLDSDKKLVLEPWLDRDDVIDILNRKVKYSQLKRITDRPSFRYFLEEE